MCIIECLRDTATMCLYYIYICVCVCVCVDRTTERFFQCVLVLRTTVRRRAAWRITWHGHGGLLSSQMYDIILVMQIPRAMHPEQLVARVYLFISWSWADEDANVGLIVAQQWKLTENTMFVCHVSLEIKLGEILWLHSQDASRFESFSMNMDYNGEIGTFLFFVVAANTPS